MSKYNSQKVTVGGITFDSKKEARRYSELALLERGGQVKDLQRQVKYVLLPAQYRQVYDKKARKWKNRCVEREMVYIADFQYTDSNGDLHVEDVKGYRKGQAYAMFAVKRKLMLYIHGIVVEEI